MTYSPKDTQYDAMTGSSSGYGQAGQAQMPTTQTTNAHELEYGSSWTGQILNAVDDMWNVLKGKGQKGGGGRDAWAIFASPDASRQPVQIEHPQQVVENAGGHARPLQECDAWDYSGCFGKIRCVMQGMINGIRVVELRSYMEYCTKGRRSTKS